MSVPEDRRFAQIALAMGLATPAQVASAFERQAQPGPARPLSDFLLDAGALREADRERIREVLRIAGVGDEDAPATVVITPGAERKTPSAVAVPAPIEERFEVLGEVARGGMGIVYRARHRVLGRVVALKLLGSGERASAEEVTRFRREAQASAKLRHPGIVEVHDFGEIDGRPWIAMEFIDGKPLDDWLALQRPSLWTRVDVIRQVAEAVEHAHAHGIVHRDLKPGNVLMDAEGRPHVADFGLAKDVHGGTSTGDAARPRRADASVGLTQSGQILGTPHYMSPEQARGDSRHIDARTDVWSLGAVFYEAMTGRRPFEADSLVNVILKVLTDEVIPPRTHNPLIPDGLEAVCLKALDKDPARRYPSAGGMAADLARFLAKERIGARSPWRGTRLWRQARQNPVVAGLAAATVALAVATAALGLLLGRSATEADRLRETAERAARRAQLLAEADTALARAEACVSDGGAGPADVREAARNAARRFREVLPHHPDEARPWEGLARALRLLGDRDGAERAFGQAVDLDPRARGAARGLAGLALDRLLDARLPGTIARAPDPAPGPVPDGDLDLLRGAVAGTDPAPAPAEGRLLALWLRRLRGEHDAVAAACAAEIAAGGRTAGFHHLRGTLATEAGAARQDFDAAVRLEPNCARWRLERAALRAAAGRTDEAFADWVRAIELGEACAAAYHGLACARLAGGNARAAIADFNRALELDPTLAESWLGRADAHWAVEDAEGAARDAGRALAARPDWAAAHERRGVACLRLGRVAEALADLERALALDPRRAPALAEPLRQARARAEMPSPGK